MPGHGNADAAKAIILCSSGVDDAPPSKNTSLRAHLEATFVPGFGSFIDAYQPCSWPPARAERSPAPGVGPAAAQPSTPTPASPGSSPALILRMEFESWGGSTSSGTRTARRSRAEVWINSGKITHPRARPGHEHLPRRPVPALDQGEEPRTPSVQPGAGSVRLSR